MHKTEHDFAVEKVEAFLKSQGVKIIDHKARVKTSTTGGWTVLDLVAMDGETDELFLVAVRVGNFKDGRRIGTRPNRNAMQTLATGLRRFASLRKLEGAMRDRIHPRIDLVTVWHPEDEAFEMDLVKNLRR